MASVKPGLRIDFMELSRLGGVDAGSERLGRASISVVEKERFREGERKELGDSEERRFVGEGYEVIGGSLLSSFKDSWCS